MEGVQLFIVHMLYLFCTQETEGKFFGSPFYQQSGYFSPSQYICIYNIVVSYSLTSCHLKQLCELSRSFVAKTYEYILNTIANNQTKKLL